MPEYLTPGVIIEELEGPKTIEGVSTSTAGFIGLTERGPINPYLVTSFEEFKRLYGGYIAKSNLAYAVDGFFTNGGKRCYISKIYSKTAAKVAKSELGSGEGKVTINTVGPGEWGNRIYYKILDSSLHYKPDDAQSTKFFKLIICYFSTKPENIDDKVAESADVYEVYDNLSVLPSSNSYYKNAIEGVSYLVRIFDDFADKNENNLGRPANLEWKNLEEGAGSNDDVLNEDYLGETIPIDNSKVIKTGFTGLEDIEDISIMCAPDADPDMMNNLVNRCAGIKDRIAIINLPSNAAGNIGLVDTPLDNKYGALYFPWVYVFDPLTKSKKLVPPTGHMAGIYARVDVERGVHKAPANESIFGITSLQVQVSADQQGILNPRGVNVIRSFPGRGNLVWGARTISKDPMWKYINVRRLFIFVEKSVKRSMQWAVFEPNNEKLWSRVKTALTDFLTNVWKTGALMGTKPEEAFFVIADRSTMTQNDLDNGRLIVVVGIAPTKPAEFVIFRFVQWQSGTNVSELL